MSVEMTPFQFKETLSTPVLDEIALLEGEGYFIHREWANGVELRKKSSVGPLGISVRCLLALAMPVIFLPFFGRTILDKIFGFKYRVFATRDSASPEVHLC